VQHRLLVPTSKRLAGFDGRKGLQCPSAFCGGLNAAIQSPQILDDWRGNGWPSFCQENRYGLTKRAFSVFVPKGGLAGDGLEAIECPPLGRE